MTSLQMKFLISKEIRRHKDHSLWSLTHIWYPKKRGDWDAIHEENDVIETREELANVKKQLKQGRHTCLVMRTEHPRDYEIH